MATDPWTADGSQPARYCTKPVEVEAMRVTVTAGWTSAVVAGWCGGRALQDRITIDTPEGTISAEPGDWIIKDGRGQFYPCPDDLFRATYMPAALVEWL